MESVVMRGWKFIRVCVCVPGCVSVYVLLCMDLFICTYIHVAISPCVYTYASSYLRTCVCPYVCVRVLVYLRPCLHALLLTRRRIGIEDAELERRGRLEAGRKQRENSWKVGIGREGEARGAPGRESSMRERC